MRATLPASALIVATAFCIINTDAFSLWQSRRLVGERNEMKFCINTALSIADQLHIDIRVRIPVTSTMKVEMYLHKQLESTFVLAMDYALEGDKASMERALSSARDIACQLQAEIDISPRVAEISNTFHYKFETLPRL